MPVLLECNQPLGFKNCGLPMMILLKKDVIHLSFFPASKMTFNSERRIFGTHNEESDLGQFRIHTKG